ncbi:STAS domain-containing protein [Novosphingobium rosa]|uniref:STAS domain-containing protein n=1 Tax=Novosphingobium rosa TaxID=76978 RepID=UPI000834068A|nr:STAS domain-containing protein [Novosphingobium rosa]
MRIIQLPARCDRAAAQAILPELQAALGSGPLQIDASATEQVGQAMLQVLLSARRTGEGAQITPSPALLHTAQLAGLDVALFDRSEA